MQKSISVSAPASVSNLGCGFDILGFALEKPQDKMTVRNNNLNKLRIKSQNTNYPVPEDPTKNVASVAIQAMLNKLNIQQGFDIEIDKQIKPGSGIGSSAASAAGAIFAVNELLQRPFKKKQLIQFAMVGETIASGCEHADNVAPCILGGITLIRSYKPIDIIPIDAPGKLFCVILHPKIEIKTSEAREILKKDVLLTDAVKQWGNVAGLITGLLKEDYELIGRSLDDYIIEPQRSKLIPAYDMLKATALNAGALGCNISGSGPSVFALTKGYDAANKVMDEMRKQYQNENIDFDIFVSSVNQTGVKISES